MWMCKKCNKQNLDNYYFCSKCGTPRPHGKPTCKKWDCGKCGCENRNDYQYCSNCGNPRKAVTNISGSKNIFLYGIIAILIVLIVVLTISQRKNKPIQQENAQAPKVTEYVQLPTDTPSIAPSETLTPMIVPSAPEQATAEERQTALLSYAELLDRGVTLDSGSNRSVDATHYYLIEMDGDGIEELIVYASEWDVEWSFAVFSYKNGSVIQIADSVNTCDISHWDNSRIELRIMNGILHASASKATVGVSAGSDNYLYYNGRSVKNYKNEKRVPVTPVKNDYLLIAASDQYGITIGSNKDFLREIYLQNHPAQMQVTTSLGDGTYYGYMNSVENVSGGWLVEMELTTFDLYSNSYIQGLDVGDTINVAGETLQITGKTDDYTSFDGGFFVKRDDGYWIACDPAGCAISYSIGNHNFFVSETTRFVDNSMMENKEVSSPWDIMNGWDVCFVISDQQITYMESTFHP